ncbi:hypothetical protein E2C01_060422 [Portunus trituberculatus]|uniref:Uncharacterized protein n=1 Tax=Portunus trituberculatus TaxID=210409 RepID=A0A5B7H9E6_PORTR|nr:hypothetical protein [Portunus trituberculatus]
MSALTKFKQSISHGKELEQATAAIPRLCLGHTTLGAHLHRLLRSQLSPLAITTLDLPTLLAASSVHHLLLGCCPVFLRKTRQLPGL